MKISKIFLTLLTIIALTFPGMSVCATELQTDKTESGEEEMSQSVVDYFYSNGIFYYNPEGAEADDDEELVAQLIAENLAQKQQILDMEDAVQFEKEQIMAIRERLNRLGVAIAILAALLLGIISYNVSTALSNRRRARQSAKVEAQGVTLEVDNVGND